MQVQTVSALTLQSISVYPRRVLNIHSGQMLFPLQNLITKQTVLMTSFTATVRYSAVQAVLIFRDIQNISMLRMIQPEMISERTSFQAMQKQPLLHGTTYRPEQIKVFFGLNRMTHIQVTQKKLQVFPNLI